MNIDEIVFHQKAYRSRESAFSEIKNDVAGQNMLKQFAMGNWGQVHALSVSIKISSSI